MGQAGAALGAAAGKNLPAVGSPHPLAETVLLGALALLGLIGTEHLHTPPTFVCCGARRPRYSTAGGPGGSHPAVDRIRPVLRQAPVIIHKKENCVNKNF